MGPTKKETLYSLQILRGVASIIVLLAHANLLVRKELFGGLFIPGWSGVDFFFVLSGFIIFYIHYNDLGDRDQVWSYSKKRIVRIFPIYWICTFGALLVDLGTKRILNIDLITWIDLDFANLIGSLTLYPTNSNAGEMPILPVAWTLSYEIFFYLVFALLIVLNRSMQKVIIVIWALGILLKGLHLISPPSSLLLDIFLSAKNFEFMTGGIVAILFILYKERFSRTTALLMLASGICLVTVSWLNASFELRFFDEISDSIKFGLPYGIIVFSAVLLENKAALRTTILNRLLIFFGNASYSIYLTHFIVIVLVTQLFNYISPYKLFFLVTTSSLIIGCFVYYFIEDPILRLLRRKFFTADAATMTKNA